MPKCYLIPEIKKLGKLVSKDEAKQKIDHQNKIACYNEHIIVGITNGYYSIAPDATFSDMFESLQNLCIEGNYVALFYYEVEAVKLAHCPKEGWYFGQL